MKKNNSSYRKDCKYRATRNRFNKAMEQAAEEIGARVWAESEARWDKLIATLQLRK